MDRRGNLVVYEFDAEIDCSIVILNPLRVIHRGSPWFQAEPGMPFKYVQGVSVERTDTFLVRPTIVVSKTVSWRQTFDDAFPC